MNLPCGGLTYRRKVPRAPCTPAAHTSALTAPEPHAFLSITTYLTKDVLQLVDDWNQGVPQHIRYLLFFHCAGRQSCTGSSIQSCLLLHGCMACGDAIAGGPRYVNVRTVPSSSSWVTDVSANLETVGSSQRPVTFPHICCVRDSQRV